LSISGSVTGSVERLTRALGGDAVLEVTGITDAGFAQDLLPAVAATPGVAHAVPMLRAPLGTGEDRALLLGADASVTALGSELAGPMGAQAAKLLSTPNGVLVGAAMGRAEGERFELGGQTVTVVEPVDAAAHAEHRQHPHAQRPAGERGIQPGARAGVLSAHRPLPPGGPAAGIPRGRSSRRPRRRCRGCR